MNYKNFKNDVLNEKNNFVTYFTSNIVLNKLKYYFLSPRIENSQQFFIYTARLHHNEFKIEYPVDYNNYVNFNVDIKTVHQYMQNDPETNFQLSTVLDNDVIQFMEILKIIYINIIEINPKNIFNQTPTENMYQLSDVKDIICTVKENKL